MIKETLKKILNHEQKDDEVALVHDELTLVSTCIDENKTFLKQYFHNSIDFTVYEFETFQGIKTLVVYIQEIMNKEVLDRDVLGGFITKSNELKLTNKEITPTIIKSLLSVSNTIETKLYKDIITDLLSGSAVFFVDKIDTAFSVPSRGWEKRAVEEPPSEAVVKGPREGFIESININRSLIRRKLKNNNLVFENIEMGRQSRTTINIAYIKGIVNRDVLTEVRQRLSKINIDAVLEAGYIEEFIEDATFTPISTVGNTQKPDIVAAKLLEGRVAILCDGTPHVMTVPKLFVEVIQASEDYYNRSVMSSLIRIMRMIALAVAILLPSYYISLESFHQDMIPTDLLLTMTGANIGIPFPAAIEAFLMIAAFELLKESGTRLPRAVGSAVSIVGALVLGDAAVNAGLVSGDMVVVSAITAICTFINPSFNEATVLFRFALMLLASFMGLYGVTVGFLFILIHMVSLRSFGIPYMSAIAPFNLEEQKDVFVRSPMWLQKLRPSYISKDNKKRQCGE